MCPFQCKEWTTALHGALSQSMVVATCYATLGEDAVIAAVNETRAAAVLVNWKKAEAFHKRAGEMPSLTTIIASTNELGSDDTWKPAAGGEGKVRVATDVEVMEMGKESEDMEATPPRVSRVSWCAGARGRRDVAPHRSRSRRAAGGRGRNHVHQRLHR